MAQVNAPLAFTHGPSMKNRFMLAPLTNTQSHADGRLSDAERNWLTLRAKGGFGLTMTCAAHVQQHGQGFPGQLGIWSDTHLEGLTRLATDIKAAGSLSAVQLHHAGMRSPKDLVGQPVAPSDDPDTGARSLSEAEVEALIADFVAAAVRAEKAGFDGVEIHGAHGYILAQFLSADTNRRTDRFGGSLANRASVIFEILDGVRKSCGPTFQLGLRLSPERFGLQLDEMVDLVREVLHRQQLDYLDMSLWDVTKEPEDPKFKGKTLMSYFTALDRGATRLGVAGKITSARRAQAMLDHGADFVLLGRAAILHHDFPMRALADPEFVQTALPVSAAYLAKEGLGDSFITYMRAWKGFVAEDA